MKHDLTLYNYDINERLIAKFPLEKRDEARLLVLNKNTEVIKHTRFKYIEDFLKKGDLLVLNNTRVYPVRIFAERKTGAKIELLFIKEKEKNIWEVMAKPLKRLKENETVYIDNYPIKVLSIIKDRALLHVESAYKIFMQFGRMPIPPYIKRQSTDADRDFYQTVYAKNGFSIASPTAGLHFTKELLERLEKTVEIEYVTLNVGVGTFLPIRANDFTKHNMEEEHFYIPPQLSEKIQYARRVIAVGTTVVRTLEGAAKGKREIQTGMGKTSLFIYPGYKFKIIDGIITNFHQPASTPLLLVCAFAKRELILNTYKEAMDKGYRFFSYGDAMFIV